MTPNDNAPDVCAVSRRGLVRRSAAVLTVTALATAALPLGLAYAAPTATAALTAAGTKVFPGIGEDLTVNVTNGGTQLVGESINFVDIKLPNLAGLKTRKAAADKIVAPAGWTASVTDLGGIQTYTFRGGSLAPGSSAAFTFPVEVAQPNADRTGALEVAVSSDNGRTSSGAGPAGSLTTRVQTLEIANLRPTGPTGTDATRGVTDGTATAGQQITYAFDVRNYAKALQNVTPTLATGNGGDKVTSPAAADIVAGTVTAPAVRTFTSTVDLGPAGARSFTAAAVAAASKADELTRGEFTVQAPAALTLNADSFGPKATRSGISRDFTIAVTKANLPRLRLTSARLEVLNPATGVVLVGKDIASATAPVDIDDNNVRTLAFEGVLLPTLPDGQLDVRFSFTGADDNTAPFSFTQTLPGALRIDGAPPVIDALNTTLPMDADGERQTAVSNTDDTVAISGRLAAADCEARITSIVVTGGSATFTVPASRITQAANDCNFTSSFTAGKDIVFPAGTTAFTVVATAVDPAGNPGTRPAVGVVDVALPTILEARTTANSITSSSARKIAVTFFDSATVKGGCSPSQWKIDSEVVVTEVQFSNGDRCVDTESRSDNVRVLILNMDRDQDLRTNVSYSPGTRPVQRPVKDGASQDAVARTIQTVIGVNPAAPAIQLVTRNTSGTQGPVETATLANGVYYTRFSGSDLTVTFLNGRTGYAIRVLDANGAKLNERILQNADDKTIVVPLGTADGRYTRSLQLVNGPNVDPTKELRSALTTITVELDTVKPAIAGVTKAGDRQVDVRFNDVLASGSDFAEDWFVSEVNPQQDPAVADDEFAYYQVGSVGGAGDTRRLTTNSDLANLGALDALYNVRNPSAVRYVDRAGNPMLNTGAVRTP